MALPLELVRAGVLLRVKVLLTSAPRDPCDGSSRFGEARAEAARYQSRERGDASASGLTVAEREGVVSARPFFEEPGRREQKQAGIAMIAAMKAINHSYYS